MNNTKTALLKSESPSNFQIKNVTLKISKKRNNEYKIEPIYTRIFFISKKRECIDST